MVSSGVRWRFLPRGAAALTALVAAGCPEPGDDVPDIGPSPFIFSSTAQEKSKIFPLIGRWFPVAEAKRLTDPTLTATQWCRRLPAMVKIELDQVHVQCDEGPLISAGIARVRTSSVPGEVILDFRAGRDSKLRQFRFRDLRGPTTTLVGSPCYGGQPTPYQRFPDYEVLTREILNGRRCTQVLDLIAP